MSSLGNITLLRRFLCVRRLPSASPSGDTCQSGRTGCSKLGCIPLWLHLYRLIRPTLRLYFLELESDSDSQSHTTHVYQNPSSS